MTPWLVHELRGRGLDVTCLDARHARAALKMQINKTDRTMPRDWRRSCAQAGTGRCMLSRSMLTALAHCSVRVPQLVGMTTRLSNHIRGVLKTFGMLPGSIRGLLFRRRVELLLADRPDVAPIVRPMLEAWRQLREQIAASTKQFDCRSSKTATCRLLMSVPGIGVQSRCWPMSAWSRILPASRDHAPSAPTWV